MKYTWLVEKYLEGELSGEALQKFELDILTKPEVAREVERIRSLNRFMKEQHIKSRESITLIEDFDDTDNLIEEDEVATDLESLKIKKVISSRKIDEFRQRIAEARAQENLRRLRSNKILVRKYAIWTAAIIVFLMMGISARLLLLQSETDYQGLYAEFYSPRPGEVERNGTDLSADPFRQAMVAYNRAEFREAFRILNTIEEDNAGNTYFLYKGICAMEIAQYELAVSLFNRLDHDELLRHESMWYKSLCFLALEDEKSTRLALKEIIESNGYYKTSARALLKKM